MIEHLEPDSQANLLLLIGAASKGKEGWDLGSSCPKHAIRLLLTLLGALRTPGERYISFAPNELL
jgi:hypothetical protein